MNRRATCSVLLRSLTLCVAAALLSGCHGGFGPARCPDVQLEAVSVDLPTGDSISHDNVTDEPALTAVATVAQAVFVRATDSDLGDRQENVSVTFNVDAPALTE